MSHPGVEMSMLVVAASRYATCVWIDLPRGS